MDGKRFCGICGKPSGTCTCAGRSAAPRTVPRSGGNWRKAFDSFTLCNDEQIVKEYEIGAVKLLGTGFAKMTVTNRRLILRMRSSFMFRKYAAIQETQIDGVTSIISSVDQGFKMKFILWGLIFAAAGVFLTFYTSGLPTMAGGAACLLLALVLLSYSRKPAYQLSIFAGNASSTIATSGNQVGIRKRQPGEGIVFTYYPTPEAYVMMNELGACVYDIKTKGDYAIDHWRR